MGVENTFDVEVEEMENSENEVSIICHVRWLSWQHILVKLTSSNHHLIEPHHEKAGLLADTNWAVQPQKMARGLKFWIKQKRDCIVYVAKTKVLISCAIIAQLICTFVFAYKKSRFSHDARAKEGIEWYRWYHWHINILQCSTNGTIGYTISANSTNDTDR